MKSSAQALEGTSPKQFITSDDKSKKMDKVNATGKKSGDWTCLTPACVHSASKMLEQMDMSIEPCDDFYNFACGNFVKETNIPDEKVSVNTFSVIGDKLQEQLRNLVSDPVNENEAEPFKLAKYVYRACMNKSEDFNFYFNFKRFKFLT